VTPAAVIARIKKSGLLNISYMRYNPPLVVDDVAYQCSFGVSLHVEKKFGTRIQCDAILVEALGSMSGRQAQQKIDVCKNRMETAAMTDQGSLNYGVREKVSSPAGKAVKKADPTEVQLKKMRKRGQQLAKTIQYPAR
jgi:hypothetical protein